MDSAEAGPSEGVSVRGEKASNLGAKGTNEQIFHVVQHIVYVSISKLFSDSLEEQTSHD